MLRSMRGGPIQIFWMRGRGRGPGPIDSVQQGGIIPVNVDPGYEKITGPLAKPPSLHQGQSF